MTQIFNSRFEISLRILLILNFYNFALSEDYIVAIDLFNTYGKMYEFTDNNLHGNNELGYSEISTRKTLFKSAFKFLIKKALIAPGETDKGFTYRITNEGMELARKLTSDYANEYRSEMEKIFSKTRNLSEFEIIKHSHKYGGKQ